MRVVVAGGTGTVGRHVVEALAERGHEPVVLSRRAGADLVTGQGVAERLSGADAVVDASNRVSMNEATAVRFFQTVTGNLVRAAHEAGVGHLVLLSIVGIDRNPHDYYAGKLAQEAVVQHGPVPWTIQRTTQFHEFAAQLFAAAKAGPVHLAPRAPLRPVAAAEVAARLAELAVGQPQCRVVDLAGPRPERLEAMIDAYARRTGHRLPVIPVSLPGKQLRGMRAGLALPGPEALLGVQTFDEWLADLPIR